MYKPCWDLHNLFYFSSQAFIDEELFSVITEKLGELLKLVGYNYMCCVMRKIRSCICKNKGTDQLHSNCEADQRLCFAKRIVHFHYFLNPKFPASSHLLCLCSLVCVRPVRKRHCWFSHKAAHMSCSSSPCIPVMPSLFYDTD